jgi:hypothetical protein
VRIDRHLAEYFLFQTFWALFKSRFARIDRALNGALDTRAILQAWQHLPESVLPAARNRRQHLSHVLSRNEVDRDYAYNRALFKRMEHGWYQFNPALQVRRRAGAEQEGWQPIFVALNLPLIGEFSPRYCRDYLRSYFRPETGLAPFQVPIMAEREAARLADEERLRQKQLQRLEAERQARQRRHPRPARVLAAPAEVPAPQADALLQAAAPWGTQAARRLARQELQRRIDTMRRQADEKE